MFVRTNLCLSRKSGPFGWVGHPTWVQRLDMTVKLGSGPSLPLLRT